MKDVPTLIRSWRRRLHLTQEQFASALGVSFSIVSRWENGHNRPGKLAWIAMYQLAVKRGVPLDENVVVSVEALLDVSVPPALGLTPPIATTTSEELS